MAVTLSPTVTLDSFFMPRKALAPMATTSTLRGASSKSLMASGTVSVLIFLSVVPISVALPLETLNFRAPTLMTEGLGDGVGVGRGEAVGGAYHPAFGELVRSELLLRKARALLRGVPADADVTLYVRPGLVSAMTGQHRRNIRILTEEMSLRSLRVKPEGREDDEIRAGWSAE